MTRMHSSTILVEISITALIRPLFPFSPFQKWDMHVHHMLHALTVDLFTRFVEHFRSSRSRKTCMRRTVLKEGE